MSNYQCISCGHIKEVENTCSCPECGCKMFSTPYDRKTVLASEIQNFIKSLMLNEIKDEHLTYFRMVLKKQAGTENEYKKILNSEDWNRFLDFNKIQNYICSADKTEQFVERLNSSFDQIEKHIGSPFHTEYETDFGCLDAVLEGYEEVLKKALSIFGESLAIAKFEFPKTRLDYSEVPNEKLLAAAKSLMGTLKELTAKILKFIKQNNIYGTAYQKKFTPKFKSEEGTDYLSVITETENNVCTILEKQYQVDIFSDGTNELHEMLSVLWNAIGVIMFTPILEKMYRFDTGETGYFKTEFYEKLIRDIHARYAVVSNTILSSSYFDSETEEELFKFYNKMIEIDVFGFMGVNTPVPSSIGECEEELNKLIGLSDIKDNIKKIKAFAVNNKDSDTLNLHMCFYGNPGTGKTEVARIIAGILYENHILPTKKVIEVDRSGLVSQYFGATAEKARSVIAAAMGGVLFIDEAYALGNNSNAGLTDYGKEAIDTLVKAMEDYRGKFCVILAGYKNEMLNMISTNPGFRSRIQFELEFPNYSRDELKDISNLMLTQRKYTLSDAALQKILDITDVKRREPNFANAREVRNILDGVILCQNVRTIGSEDTELGMVDVNKYIKDSKINLPIDISTSKILTAEDELDNLIGLDSVKRMVRKIRAFAKRNKNQPDFNLHMCFYGNPGTGKTEVARILSRILYDADILPEAKLVETDSHGLIGNFVGETAPKTRLKIADAMGGVLFIDEAYGLTNTGNSYGTEAIETLLKNMEDHRGHFCAIFAGYKQEMITMLNSNPGLKSRVQFAIEFPDYTRDELGRIAIKFLEKKKYTIESSALDLLLDVTEYYRFRDNFANARTVRNLLDQVIMNQNLRTEDGNNAIIIRSDVEDYIFDERIDLKI